MWLTAAVKNGLLPSTGIEVYYVLYRLPSIIIDLATSMLIYDIVRRYVSNQTPNTDGNVQSTLPILGAACYVLNPAIIFNSAIWSQIDATFTFGMLLAVALMLRGQAEWAVVSYVVAFLIKPQAISLAPLLGLALLLRFNPRRWIKAGVIGVVVAYLIIVPFLGWNAFVALYNLLGKSVETYPYTSMFTYNLWGIFGFWQDDRVPLWLGINARLFGTLLYLVGLAVGAWLFVHRLKRSADDALSFMLFGTYFTFLPVMVLTRMHERYLYPVLPFLLLLALLSLANYGFKVDQRMMVQVVRVAPLLIYMLITTLHTFNLYQVYIYYLNFDDGVPRTNTLFHFINDGSKLWSAITLLIFGVVVGILLRQHPMSSPQTIKVLDQRKD
jgi:Gpi18-like mannosyltransferase